MVNTPDLFGVGTAGAYDNLYGDIIDSQNPENVPEITTEYGTYRSVDFSETEVTAVDIALLRELDRFVAWGLKYGLHVNIQFANYPGHQEFKFGGVDGFTADTDFLVNSEKQRQTANMWKVLMQRYKGISNNALSFQFNHEPDNPGQTSPATIPNITEQNIVDATLKVLNELRTVDEDRFLYYESRYTVPDGSTDTNSPFYEMTQAFKTDGKVAMTCVANACTFEMWNNINDVATESGYFPAWDNYTIPGNLYESSGKTSIKVNGVLPINAVFNIALENYNIDAEAIYVQGFTSAEDMEGELITSNLTEANLTFTLQKEYHHMEIYFGNSYINDFRIDMQNVEGVTTWRHYYTDGASTVNMQNVVIKEDSIVDVQLGDSYDRYESLNANEKEMASTVGWILDDDADFDLTITENEGTYSYTSNYGFTEDTVEKYVEYFTDKCNTLGIDGFCHEISVFKCNYNDAVCAYFEDMCRELKEKNIGWSVWFRTALYFSYYADDAYNEALSSDGNMLYAYMDYSDDSKTVIENTELLDVLQAYQGERPQFSIDLSGYDGKCVEHSYVDGICIRCYASQLTQDGFGFSVNTLTKTYQDASFTMAAIGAAEGSTVTYESSHADVATVDNNGTVTILKSGTATITATASEIGDYKQATASYELVINKADTAPNLPEATMNVAYTITTVAEVDLPKGWVWQETDKTKVLEIDKAVTATATYNGADKGNYATESVEVSVIRQACTNTGDTEIRDVKGATCEEEGYTGNIYCKMCGKKLASGKIVAKKEHSYDKGKVTKEPTGTEEGKKTYTCIVCGLTKEEKIPAAEAIEDDDKKAPVVGEKITDKSGKAIYRVTKSTAKSRCVTYEAPTNKNVSKIIVPATIVINGITYKVTSISNTAFAGNKKLTSVTIGNYVTSISAKTFKGCTNLKTVIIGNGVIKISANAFKNLKKLVTVKMGTGVKTIGAKAFYGCTKLKTVTIKSTKLTNRKIGDKAFGKTPKSMTVKLPKKKFSTYKSMMIKRGVNKKAKFKKV